MSVKIIDEGIPYGVYIWEIDGRPVVDEDFNYLIAPARRGDLRAISRLTDFVHRELGIFDGGPVFQEGARPISEQEWREQNDRAAAGEVADPYDLGNLIDEYNYRKELDSK